MGLYGIYLVVYKVWGREDDSIWEDSFWGPAIHGKTHETSIAFITQQSQDNRALDRIMIQLFEGL